MKTFLKQCFWGAVLLTVVILSSCNHIETGKGLKPSQMEKLKKSLSEVSSNFVYGWGEYCDMETLSKIDAKLSEFYKKNQLNYSCGYALTKDTIDGKYRFIDWRNNYCGEFDYAEDFHNGWAKVSFEGKTDYISINFQYLSSMLSGYWVDEGLVNRESPYGKYYYDRDDEPTPDEYDELEAEGTTEDFQEPVVVEFNSEYRSPKDGFNEFLVLHFDKDCGVKRLYGNSYSNPQTDSICSYSVKDISQDATVVLDIPYDDYYKNTFRFFSIKHSDLLSTRKNSNDYDSGDYIKVCSETLFLLSASRFNNWLVFSNKDTCSFSGIFYILFPFGDTYKEGRLVKIAVDEKDNSKVYLLVIYDYSITNDRGIKVSDDYVSCRNMSLSVNLYHNSPYRSFFYTPQKNVSVNFSSNEEDVEQSLTITEITETNQKQSFKLYRGYHPYYLLSFVGRLATRGDNLSDLYNFLEKNFGSSYIIPIGSSDSPYGRLNSQKADLEMEYLHLQKKLSETINPNERERIQAQMASVSAAIQQCQNNMNSYY